MTFLLALDIDGVIRDVSGSYLKALADTVEHYTEGRYRPTLPEIDTLKGEGIWNNDWEAAQELIRRFDPTVPVYYPTLVEFFQARYLGENFGGYIREEPLLVDRAFFDQWDAAGIAWGFVSGASRTSAEFVLCQRLGLMAPPLIAMGEAPDKPNPGGLFKLVAQFPGVTQVVYAGDTVADVLTGVQAQAQDPSRTYRAVGILPPHNQSDLYRAELHQAGAHGILTNLAQLTPQQVWQWFL